MSGKYRIAVNEKAYFLTLKVVNWIDVFMRKNYKLFPQYKREKILHLLQTRTVLNYISVVVLILISTLFVKSQNVQKNIYSLPLEFGINVNKIDQNHQNIESKTGFGLSVLRIWNEDKKVNILSGLQFNKTRYLDNDFKGGINIDYKNMLFDIYTFSIPVLIRLTYGNKRKWFIEAGPSLDIVPVKWGKGIEVDYNPLGSQYEKAISGYFEHEFIEFGANIGLGFKFPFKKIKLGFESSYHFGLQNQIDKYSNCFVEKIIIIIN